MLEIIIALAAAIFLGNTLAHRIRVTPAILLIFLGLALALLPAMHELREVGLPSYVILEIFLPIMLFWEARNTSLREVRKSLSAIITSGTVNCRGFFGLLFSYPFGLFIPRVLDT